jgi:crotonobetainyl-CoA hydratase
MTAAEQPAALYETRGDVAVVTLNRPLALNAVNSALATAVGEALSAAAADDRVRVVVITGTGRSFCAGADLKELAAGRSIEPEGHPEWGFAGVVRHWIDKPVIAAVNGFAMGGGTEIVLACDLAVASTEATFGLPEVKRGLIAAAGGVLRIQRQIPIKRALEVVLTGDPVDAETAAQWGLVNRVVTPEQLMPAVLDLASRIAGNAPLSVQHSKRTVHRTATGRSDWGRSWSDDPWDANSEATAAVFGSRDAKEGPRAFAERRPPVWEGQ